MDEESIAERLLRIACEAVDENYVPSNKFCVWSIISIEGIGSV